MPRKKTPSAISPQSHKNGDIHDWYRIVLGFSDHLVTDLITEFNLKPSDRVLDPFSGSGTTALECKKQQIDCWAVDANPSSYFAAQVKTTWSITAGDLIAYAFLAAEQYDPIRRNSEILRKDPTYRYLQKAGMLKRAWIGGGRLLDVIAIKKAIISVGAPSTVRRALQLGLMREFVHNASNVRFGPELYCGKARRGVRVIDDYLVRVALMEDDLATVRGEPAGRAQILFGDSRELSRKLLKMPRGKFCAVITSPPYPTEHDYTRNSRLELALLENVIDRETLQAIKKGMIRSHTKGIYSTDADEKLVHRLPRIRELVRKIEKKAATKEYGFARLYGKVTKEYFGGMRRHFRSLYPLLKPGGLCAYVVGDQASYFQVKIATAEILGDIAEAEGFKVSEIRIWRKRWATTTQRFMNEHILLFRKPQRRARR